MMIVRKMTITAAVAGIAIGSASPAWADDRLDGEYTFINGPTSNTWSITTQCTPEATCGGSVSSSTGMLAAIRRQAGGPWTIERHDVFNGMTCADGGTGAADLVYSFDPVTLLGTISYTSKPGACNDPSSIQSQQPVSLVKA
jgi:hypothetical protein